MQVHRDRVYWHFPRTGGGGGLVAKLCLILATPWTVACQAPLSMGFARQEHWSGLPFPPPGDLSNPGIKLVSPVAPALAGRLFTTEPPERFQVSKMGLRKRHV